AAHTRELLDPRDLLARRLVILEDTLLDDQPLIRWHSLVVPCHSTEGALLRAVRLDVHDGRAVLQLTDDLLRRRHEARARVVCFFTDGAIELGRMADRLVDRQP